MTLSVPVTGVHRRPSRLRAILADFNRLDVLLASILLGPLAVLQVAGRTPNLFWVDVVTVAIATYAFAKLSLRPDNPGLRVPSAIAWALAYVLICAASMLVTEDILLSVATLKLRIFPIIVFLLAYRLPREREDVEHFLRSVTVLGAAIAAISLYNWYQFSSGVLSLGEEMGPKDMLQLAFGRSNYLASIFVLVIPTMIAFIHEKKMRPAGLAYLAGLLLVSVALLFTQSRGAMISLALGLSAWGSFSLLRNFRGKTVLKVLFALALLCAGVVVLWDWIPEDIRFGLSTAFSLLWSDSSGVKYGSGRVELWLGALKGAWDSNLLGIGLGNQAAWYARANIVESAQSAHSLYLETLLETGVLGFVALLGILFCFGRTIWRLWKISPRDDRAFTGALLATFVTSLVNVSQEPSFWAPQYATLFWMMMGVAYAWARLIARDRSAPPSLEQRGATKVSKE